MSNTPRCCPQVEKYEEYLEAVPHRDPTQPPKKMGEKTIDDEIELLRPTPDQKMEYLQKFEACILSSSVHFGTNSA